MKVVIYSRVSVQAQKKQLNEQTEKLKKYAETMGWTIVETFVDLGGSGRDIKRPVLQNMINFIETHDVDKVLVIRLNRLSSNPLDVQFLIEDVFSKNNTGLVALYENVDTALPYDKEITSIKELRIRTGMSQSQFADYFHIPKQTLQNWEQDRRECPQYLLELIEYKLEKERKFKITLEDLKVLNIMGEFFTESENKKK